MKIDLKNPEDLATLINIATSLIPLAVKLSSMVKELIANSDIPEADKNEYIARIKEAQASVPEW